MFGIDHFSDYLAISSILVSIFTVVYVSKFSRFELRNTYRNEILKWFESTIEILLELEKLHSDGQRSKELLTELSRKIELGRFYFPNEQSKKTTNMDKNIPIAYRGKRHIILDCLVVIYDIYKSDSFEHHSEKVIVMRRQLTSEIFYLLEPHKFLGLSKKHRLSKGLSSENIKNILGSSAEVFRDELYSEKN